LVSLDTNTWSLIIFMMHVASLFAIIAIFAKPLVITAIVVAVSWLLSQAIFIYYGHTTDQLGFILLGIFNIIIAVLGAILKIGDEDDEDI
jgi:hypothetical protein